MTFSGFTYLLRFLVLCGLCLANTAFAAAQCTILGVTGSTPTATCQTYANVQVAPYPWVIATVSATSTACLATYTNRDNGNSNSENLTVSCSCNSVSNADQLGHHYTSFSSTSGDLAAPIPAQQCKDNCVGELSGSFTPKEPVTYSTTSANCESTSNAVGSPVHCYATYKNTGATCFTPPPPTCTPPQQLNANNVCETPACPTGQVRETALGACKPIVCTAPLVKVGSNCELPKCPAGETYEYKNGAGSCVKNDPLCTPPMVNVNGICKLPTCPTGMVLDSVTGSCKLNPATNNTTGTGNNTTGTGNNTTGTGNSTTPGTGTTTTTTTGNTTTTTTTGATNTTTAGTSGTATNTNNSGTCTTAPCGDCDPTKETCGNTFGGSCKSDFKCNGDAIQCAVALATNKAECATKSLRVDEENDTAFIEGKAAFDGGTKALGTQGGIQVANGGSIGLNRLNPFSSGCPQDIPFFSYKGTNYVLPIAQFCNIWQMMGAIMLVIAGLISIKILMKVD